MEATLQPSDNPPNWDKGNKMANANNLTAKVRNFDATTVEVFTNTNGRTWNIKVDTTNGRGGVYESESMYGVAMAYGTATNKAAREFILRNNNHFDLTIGVEYNEAQLLQFIRNGMK